MISRFTRAMRGDDVRVRARNKNGRALERRAVMGGITEIIVERYLLNIGGYDSVG